MAETRQVAEKRLLMRSMRRGIREMDLILQAWSRARLSALSDADLATYDRMLDESDHDIYAWICERAAPPTEFAPLVADIAAASQGVARP